MTDQELIFTMPGERVTSEISQKEQTADFPKSREVARTETERELGHRVATPENFLETAESGKRRRISSGKTE